MAAFGFAALNIFPTFVVAQEIFKVTEAEFREAEVKCGQDVACLSRQLPEPWPPQDKALWDKAAWIVYHEGVMAHIHKARYYRARQLESEVNRLVS